MSDNGQEKTTRIGIVSLTLVVLGIILAVVKTNACAGCSDPSSPPKCHDEFYEFTSDRHTATCDQGAIAEVVNAPPAPKAGILCHCPPRQPVAPAPSASGQP